MGGKIRGLTPEIFLNLVKNGNDLYGGENGWAHTYKGANVVNEDDIKALEMMMNQYGSQGTDITEMEKRSKLGNTNPLGGQGRFNIEELVRLLEDDKKLKASQADSQNSSMYY